MFLVDFVVNVEVENSSINAVDIFTIGVRVLDVHLSFLMSHNLTQVSIVPVV